jgi:N-acetylmuramoyl-L-alanine amidase
MKVIIDCGHGGMVDGKYQCIAKHAKSYRFPDGFEVFEGVINRKIGSKLEHKLQLANIPFISLSTHDQNDLPLSERVRRINKWYESDKSLFVLSIHANKMTEADSGPGNTGRGFEVYYRTKESKVLALELEKLYKAEFPEYRWRGTYENSFFSMLTGPKCPSVLTENLFYDNRPEAEFISSDAGQERIANVLFNFVEWAHKN